MDDFRAIEPITRIKFLKFVTRTGLLTLALGSVLTARCFGLGSELLTNPGFENAYTGGHSEAGYAIDHTPLGYSTYKGAADEAVFANGKDYQWIDAELIPGEKARTGKRCLKINGSWHFPYDDPRVKQDTGYTITSIDRNAYYLFQCWYRTEGVVDADVEIRLLHQVKGSTSFFWADQAFFGPSEEWTQVSMVMRPFKSSEAPFAYSSDSFNGTEEVRTSLGLISSPGAVYFDDLSFRKLDMNNAADRLVFAPNSYDVPTPSTSGSKPSFPATDFYTVQRDSRGTWWFVRPEGTPTWLIGVNNVEDPGDANPILSKWIADHYSDGSYRDAMTAKLREWHFTASDTNDTAGSTRSTRGYFKYFDFSNSSYVKTAHRMKTAGGGVWRPDDGAAMADPYNTDWQVLTREKVMAMTAKELSDPEFVGYYTANGIAFENMYEAIWSTACAAEFVNFLKQRYSTAKQVASAWSSKYVTFSFSSWDSIYENRAKITIHGYDDSASLRQDLYDFEKKVWQDYAKFTVGLIREREAQVFGSDATGMPLKKHLICTNRYPFNGYPNRMQPSLDRHIDALAELQKQRPGYYYDILALTHYPGKANIPTHKSVQNMAYLESLSKKMDLPVMAAEFGLGGEDWDYPTHARWRDRTNGSQAERGAAYRKFVYTLAQQNYYIGAFWYQWFDGIYSSAGPTPIDPSNAAYDGRNSGIVNSQNEPYTDFVNEMSAANEVIGRATRQNIGGTESFDWDTAGGWPPPTPGTPSLYYYAPQQKFYMAWQPSHADDLSQYVIYGSDQANYGFSALKTLSASLPLADVTSCVKSHMRVAARDKELNESSWSEVAESYATQSVTEPTIVLPKRGDSVQPGETFSVIWLPPDTARQVQVTISSSEPVEGTILARADSTANSGWVELTVPSSIPPGTQLRVMIVSTDGAEPPIEMSSPVFYAGDAPKQNAAQHWEFY